MTEQTLQDFTCAPLTGAPFGCALDPGGCTASEVVAVLERGAQELRALFYAHDGLLVIRNLGGIAQQPQLLVRITRLFGPEVENYRATITTPQFFHDSVDQILVLSNRPPCSYAPPQRPQPALTADGSLPVQYPQRRGWHTDQSYRRPPPDVSLLLGLECPPPEQGQTLYADGVCACAELPETLRRRVGKLQGVHAMRWTGRTESEVRAGDPVKPLLAHQLPQRQPLVRRHPETGKPTLYLCDDGQMDFVAGPIDGLAPGPDGEGAQLLRELLYHLTQPRFVYVHEWRCGDLVIHDNRNMIHTATWYDAERHARLMWRTTAMGNPGEEYAGESRSWIPAPGTDSLQGLESLKF